MGQKIMAHLGLPKKLENSQTVTLIYLADKDFNQRLVIARLLIA
jgi:hypothetical protein